MRAFWLPGVSFAPDAGSTPGPRPGDGGGKRGLQRPFVEAWKAADTNHDGFLSKDEFDVMPRIQNLPEEKRLHLFNRLDKDQDGKLSREELGRMGKPREGQGPPCSGCGSWMWTRAAASVWRNSRPARFSRNCPRKDRRNSSAGSIRIVTA